MYINVYKWMWAVGEETRYKVLINVGLMITVYAVPLAVWRFGGFSSNRQIKITTNTVVLSQVLINSNDEQAYPPN